MRAGTSRGRRILELLRSGALILVISLVLVELLLQTASLFAQDRATPWRPNAKHKILCVGDSHTYGVDVDPGETYPEHLQRRLDERAPGLYSVVNFGLPGLNASQLNSMLPGLLESYRPSMVLVWCGINNSWNRASGGAASESSPARELLHELRTYRLIRVWFHDRQLDRDTEQQTRGWNIVRTDNPFTGRDRFTVQRYDGALETFQHDGDAVASETPEWQPGLERDYASIARHARSAGVPIAFIAYPLDGLGVAGIANRALHKISEEYRLPVIETKESVARIPPEERHFLVAAHPDGRMYGEIAADVLPVVLSLLPPD